MVYISSRQSCTASQTLGPGDRIAARLNTSRWEIVYLIRAFILAMVGEVPLPKAYTNFNLLTKNKEFVFAEALWVDAEM